MCTSIQGISAQLPGVPSAKVCLSAQVLCTGSQGIYTLCRGVPLAQVGSSAQFGVLVFKASMLDSPVGEGVGGSISQSSFTCQVWCSGIQSIYYQLPTGVHLPKYVHLPSFVYWYSKQISPVRVEISYSHLGVFQGCLRHVLGDVEWVTSYITVQC